MIVEPDKKEIKKRSNFLHRRGSLQGGFTYAELIVVLTIFTMISSVAIFDYRKFQAKVDINNLATDVALKFAEAQKSSLGGRAHPSAPAGWKPSYGIYFNLTTGANTGNKIFYYFADLDQDQSFDHGSYACPQNECIEKFSISKGNYISRMEVFYTTGSAVVAGSDLELVFTRPNSGAAIRWSGSAIDEPISHVEVTVTSPNNLSSKVQLYASGRIDIR